MLFEGILIVATVFLISYRYVTKNFDRWKNVGIPYMKGTFPYGSHIEILTQSKHINELFREGYEKYRDEDFHGMFLFGKPVLVVHNTEMLRHVMVKDFNYFVDRNDSNFTRLFDGGEYDQYWLKQLTSLNGDEWKDVRSTFSPIFTSGKMKSMLRFIIEIAQSLKTEFKTHADSGRDFELREVFGKFSLDSLAYCAFGINPKSFEDEKTTFVKNAAKMFTINLLDNIKIFSRLLPYSAELQKMLNLSILKPKETKFFFDVIKKTIKHRRETGDRPNDLIDMMIDCMKPMSGTEKDSYSESHDQFEKDMKLEHKKISELDEDMVVSTAFILLVAGYDTTGMTLSYIGYFFSKHQDIQTRLQNEIDQAYEENEGKLPEYQIIQELPYLEMCIMESVRCMTPVGGMLRACTKDYRFPNSNVEVKVNDLILIPAYGIHKDERYYPNPEQFNPENFSKKAKQSRSPFTFLGFGQGPRACIGMRFALLETKVAVMEVLHNYSFIYSNKNPKVLQIDPQSQLGYIKGGLYAKIEHRN